MSCSVWDCDSPAVRRVPHEDAPKRNPDTGLTRSETLAEAQVHATLAQVAATIDARGYGAFEIRNDHAWEQVLGKPVNRPIGTFNGDCTDTSDCPSPVHDPECPARGGRR